MGQAVVIDLGDLRQPQEIATGGRPRQASPGPLVLAAVLLGVLGGAAPPPTPLRPAVIPAAVGDTTLLVGDRYYVVGRAGSSGAGTLAAYQLPDGRLIANLPLRVPGVVVGVRAVGDVLVVASRDQLDGRQKTTGVDARTGHTRWQQSAASVGMSASGQAAVLVDTEGASGDRRWAAVEPATGRLRWTYVVGPGDITYVPWQDGPTTRLVVMKASGGVEVRDTETGAVTVSAPLRRPVGQPESGPAVWTSNGLLLIGGETGITAYGLDRLDLRWRNDVRMPGGFVHPFCGDLICFVEPTTGMRVIDPATGQVRWGSDRWSASTRAGGYLLADAVDPAQLDAPHAVLDARTGRFIGSMGAWQPFSPARSDGKVIGVRPALADERMWFAMLDPAALSVRVLGVAAGVTGNCQLGSAAFVCQRLDGAVGVWRLPPG